MPQQVSGLDAPFAALVADRPVLGGLPAAAIALDRGVVRAPAYGAAADRALNFTLALVALLVLFPLFCLVALAVRLSSPGPVLFRQTRVGRHPGWRDRALDPAVQGQFTILKFRTMRNDPPGRDGWAVADDPRLTPVGAVLRRYRLDELPQFINVLRGDMNIVGPRPERPHIFAWLDENIPGFHERKRVKPGITGLAQVRQLEPWRVSTDDDKLRHERAKLHHDMEYIRAKSVPFDLAILARTAGALVFRRIGP